MSECSSDESTPGWEFVKSEDVVETSDGESVEVIGFSCPEDESEGEDVVDHCEDALQVVEDEVGPENVQTYDLVEVKKEAIIPANLSNVWESFVVIMTVTSVGLAVTAFLFHAEELRQNYWASEPSAELSVALEELQKYQKINIVLNKEISQLKKVIQKLEIQVSKLELEHTESHEEESNVKMDNMAIELDEEKKNDESIVFTESQPEFSRTTNLNEKLSNLTSNFKIESESLKEGLKTNINDLNNQVAHNILKTSLDIKKKLYQKLCPSGHFKEECKDWAEVKNEQPISETIEAITKEVAFSWMKFYEDILEKKLDEISHEISNNIEANNVIFNSIVNHLNSSHVEPQRKTRNAKKPKKDKKTEKVRKKEEKQYKKIKEKKEKTSKREIKSDPKKEKNFKRKKTNDKEKKKEKENQSFYFDKKKWKYVKFEKQNKTRLNRPKKCGYKLNKNYSFNKTFGSKKEGFWFTNLGKHRSGMRWEEARSEWQFDRARNRRLRKS